MLKHTLLLPLFFCALISQAQQTVADIIIASENHNTLELAVSTAELVETLEGDGPFTVFAPTDAAFSVLLDTLDITADSLLSFPNLGDILLYHVLGDSVQSGDLMPTQMVTMANMDEATITSDSTGVMINGVAMVTMADIEATNGVVHVIDAVLLPPEDEEESLTIAGIVDTSSVHTVLSALLDSTGLDATLSGEGPFTVFAPTDAAIDALDPLLILSLVTDPDFVELTSILTYHVASGTVMSGDLSDGQNIPTVNGADVTISIDTTGTVMINGVATVIIADVEASNGVIHVIDAVLTPPAPNPATVVDIIVDSPDHTLLELAVGAANLVEALSGEGPFTVFAPTDAAIVNLVTALDITADELLALETLGDILTYHVVGGTAALSTDLSDGQIIPTLQGGDVEISIDTAGVVKVNDATVIVADLVADNGVVHVIDMVLSLPTGVEDVDLNALFEVYPNPTTDAIRWNGMQVDRLEVIDAQGRTRIATTNPGNMVDLSALEAGMFFVVIEADGERLVKSVLKH